jgi:hypothetical protein
MSRRREKRNFLALPVRASYVDATGNGLRRVVCTLDLSAKGARVMGLPEVAVGQEVTLEHKKNRVRFEVVWVGQPGTARQGQVGLCSLEGDKKIADIEEFLAGDYVDRWSPGQMVLDDIQADRRAVHRFDCDRTVRYWSDKSTTALIGQLENISMNGCFVSTAYPLPRRRQLALVMSLYGMKISARGEVRACWEGEGMGVMFTAIDHDNQVRLSRAVERLTQSTHQTDSSPHVDGSEGNERILQDVRSWFDRNLTMSWADFFDIQVRCKGNLVRVSFEREY